MTCKNCDEGLQGEFCYLCGQKVIKERITIRHLLQTFLKTITNVEKGFWHTTKMLFVAPHTVVKDYWNGKTIPYYSPIRFLLIWATVSVLINLWLGAFEVQQADMQEMIGAPALDSEAAAMQERFNNGMKQYMNFMVFFQLPFYGFFAYLFFKKEGLNYAEHLVGMTFFLAATSFLSIFLLLGLYLIPDGMHYFMTLGLLTYPAYYTYAYKKLFDLNWFTAVWKSVFIFLLGVISFIFAFSVVLLLIGMVAVFVFGFKPG